VTVSAHLIENPEYDKAKFGNVRIIACRREDGTPVFGNAPLSIATAQGQILVGMCDACRAQLSNVFYKEFIKSGVETVAREYFKNVKFVKVDSEGAKNENQEA
jgi:hypothetical protein